MIRTFRVKVTRISVGKAVLLTVLVIEPNEADIPGIKIEEND
jgi:hypothetical protein